LVDYVFVRLGMTKRAAARQHSKDEPLHVWNEQFEMEVGGGGELLRGPPVVLEMADTVGYLLPEAESIIVHTEGGDEMKRKREDDPRGERLARRNRIKESRETEEEEDENNIITVHKGMYDIYYPNWKLLGEGADGQVYQCRRRKDGKEVAVKVSSDENSLSRMRVEEELNFTKPLGKTVEPPHNAFVQNYRAYAHGDQLYMEMQLVRRAQTLKEFCAELELHPRAPFNGGERDRILEAARLITPLLYTLQKLHDNGLTHNDIHGSNIVWDKDSDRFLLIDFGRARDENNGPLQWNIERDCNAFSMSTKRLFFAPGTQSTALFEKGSTERIWQTYFDELGWSNDIKELISALEKKDESILTGEQ
jgi:serine/threonine protein kinase